jgi:hypothetical protein
MAHWREFSNSEIFPTLMSNFLFSSFGAKFRENFKFSDNLTCGQPAPDIKVNINFFFKLKRNATFQTSRFEVQYLPFSGPEEHIPAKRRVDELIHMSGIPGGFSFFKIYG